jgi:hypothetical protein
MTIPVQTIVPRPETNLPVEWCHTHRRWHQVQARTREPTTEQEAVPRQSKLTGKQAATMVQPHVPPQHEPTLKAERILMVDFTSTQARAKEVAPPTSREGARMRPPRPSPWVPHLCSPPIEWTKCIIVDVLYAAPQAHGIVNVALH